MENVAVIASAGAQISIFFIAIAVRVRTVGMCARSFIPLFPTHPVRVGFFRQSFDLLPSKRVVGKSRLNTSLRTPPHSESRTRSSARLSKSVTVGLRIRRTTRTESLITRVPRPCLEPKRRKLTCRKSLRDDKRGEVGNSRQYAQNDSNFPLVRFALPDRFGR